MNKATWSILLFSFLLAACNLPLGKATPDPRVVGTLVQMTLTAAPESKPSNTPPSPDEATTTSPAPLSPTATETELPMATITATPTIGTEDPRTQLGSPAWLNPLDHG